MKLISFVQTGLNNANEFQENVLIIRKHFAENNASAINFKNFRKLGAFSVDDILANRFDDLATLQDFILMRTIKTFAFTDKERLERVWIDDRFCLFDQDFRQELEFDTMTIEDFFFTLKLSLKGKVIITIEEMAKKNDGTC